MASPRRRAGDRAQRVAGHVRVGIRILEVGEHRLGEHRRDVDLERGRRGLGVLGVAPGRRPEVAVGVEAHALDGLVGGPHAAHGEGLEVDRTHGRARGHVHPVVGALGEAGAAEPRDRAPRRADRIEARGVAAQRRRQPHAPRVIDGDAVGRDALGDVPDRGGHRGPLDADQLARREGAERAEPEVARAVDGPTVGAEARARELGDDDVVGDHAGLAVDQRGDHATLAAEAGEQARDLGRHRPHLRALGGARRLGVGAGGPRDRALVARRERGVPGAALLLIPRQNVVDAGRRLDAGDAVALDALGRIAEELHEAAVAVGDRDVAGEVHRGARRVAHAVGPRQIAALGDERARVDLDHRAGVVVRDPDVGQLALARAEAAGRDADVELDVAAAAVVGVGARRAGRRARGAGVRGPARIAGGGRGAGGAAAPGARRRIEGVAVAAAAGRARQGGAQQQTRAGSSSIHGASDRG